MSIPQADIERARARPLEHVAEQRGLTLRRVGVELVGPCPICGGRDRFRISTRKQVFKCRRCDARGGGAIDFVRFLDSCSLPLAVETLIGTTGTATTSPPVSAARAASEASQHRVAEYEAAQHRKATWLWRQQSLPIEGTIAKTYLREPRGITCPLPATVRFLAPSKPEHHPALIVPFGLPDEPEPGVLSVGEVAAVQLTLLLPDGSGKADVKPNKITVGSPAGMPIVLAPPNDLLGLAICEGVEDALTAHAATGLGAWASGGASFFPALADAIPDYIEAITIYAHDDGGKRYALELAAKCSARGFVEVRVEGLS